MACEEFEDLLLDYHDLSASRRAAVDAHLSLCEDCRAYRQVLADMDAGLTREFAGEALSGDFAIRVREVTARIPAAREPSLIPVALDLAGAVSAFAIVLFLLFWFGADKQVGLAAFVAAGMLFAALSAVFAWRTLLQSNLSN